ncbi:phage tail protein [Acinetobacter silvestris]|uniref:Phage tail protein n=1 Tax=Acinetobacter silvestris TaxID=1977882 RepID=A0A1Y3CHS5_9GAMM|nr:phage tail protein [Acinetobacter silvestris]OTG65928.1 phage tail protein [Acinetobacter silvestris]
MKKPNHLREYLLTAIPDLSPDQDRLLIFTNNGNLRSTMASGYSFEMSYILDLTITDYSGDVDVIGVVLFTWIAEHQSELMANVEKSKKAITFEAELIDNSKYDINFQIPLTERVIVKKNDEGKLELSYPSEPQYTPFDPPTEFTILDSSGNELTSWTTADKLGWSLDMPPTGKNP